MSLRGASAQLSHEAAAPPDAMTPRSVVGTKISASQ